ncbi:MAG: hypothetical protein LBR94_01360 [Desulfovibrio sp.]|jgi:hypothetical protein|nr:hypothetical protein [Desulfovibrio sp.]
MRKFVVFFLMAFSLSCLAACGDDKEGIKLSKQPYDASKCATYRNLAMKALKKNERDIVDALKPYNDKCLMNMDSIKDAHKTKGMADPF